MRRTIVTCLAAVALVAGCSGEAEPKEPDGPSTATAEPSATPPPLPDAATQETAEGAASFVDHYLDVLNYASLSGDTAPLENLSAGTCVACQRYIDTVLQTYESGGDFEGGAWSLGDVQVQQLTSVWSVIGTVTTTAGTQIPSAGAEPRQSPETSTSVEFQISRVDMSWRLMSLSGPES